MKVYLVWHYSTNDDAEYEEDRHTSTALLEIFDTKEKAIEYVKNFEGTEEEAFVYKDGVSDFVEKHRDTINELRKEEYYFRNCTDEEVLSTVLPFYIIDKERYDPDHNNRYIGCGSWSHILFTTEKEVK